MRNIITVGLGDYYTKILNPTIKKLESENLAKLIATVDVKDVDFRHLVDHIVRKGEPLPQTLKEYKQYKPLVILAHSNHMHVPDAIDLTLDGFDVALEKPYALQLESFRTLMQCADPSNYYLLEYYLTMKASPLLFGYGKIEKNSFYCLEGLLKEKRGLVKYADSLESFFNILPQVVGEIKSVQVDLLEGEGETGSLAHRGVSLVDIRAGGGMIQDLGIHALAPVIALEREIGEIKMPHNKAIKVAASTDYVSMVESRFGLDRRHIAETYAELSFTSSKNISVFIRVGKYILKNRNQRGITIVGTQAKVFLDMNDCVLSIDDVPVMEIEKNEYKYYPVIRSSIEFFNKHPLFRFDINKVASHTQELILKIQDEVYRTLRPSFYQSGSEPEEIFKK